MLACGAFLKNRACLIDGDQAHWSALHGDLGDATSRDALAQALDTLLARATGPLHAVAHDLHPDFYSTHLAIALAQRLGVPAIGVQHHHTHIGVVLAEQPVDGPVIGLALDGMGLGHDGGTWGGEVLWVGGCLVNRVLGQRLRAHLNSAGLTVLEPRAAGCGDAGLALGQAWIAGCTPLVGLAVSVEPQLVLET